MERLIGLVGIVALLAIAVLFSSNRRWIRLRVVVPAFLLQAGFAVLVIGTPWGRAVIQAMSNAVSNLLGYAKAGTDFIFGPLAAPEMGGHSFAIAALPVIIFFASLISILYYLGIMQLVIKWVGGAIQKITGITKVESLGAAANIFVGQSESPLVIRPYLAGLSPSQLFTIMTVGMAGVAGTILGAYASMIGEQLLPYLLAASFMSAPGGILMAKIMMPDDPKDLGIEPVIMPEASHDEEKPANIIMAAAQGAQTGVKLAVAVGAMVLAFVALVALANGLARRDRRLVRLSRPVVPGRDRRDLPPRHVADGRAVGRKRGGRRPVRQQDRAQRIRRLHRPWQGAGRHVAGRGRDRDLCALRFRQFQLDRDPDGGDRRAGPEPAPDDREAGAEGAARGQPVEPDVGGARGADAGRCPAAGCPGARTGHARRGTRGNTEARCCGAPGDSARQGALT
jgi:nucleoside transporter